MKKKRAGLLAGVFICGIVVLAVLFAGLYMKRSSGDTGKKGMQVIREGEQKFKLNKVLFEKDGLTGLTDQLKNAEGYPEKANIAYLNASVTKKGEVRDFTLTLEGFDALDQYTGDLSFGYDSEKQTLSYIRRNQTELPSYYNSNYDIDFLDTQIRRIPFEAEIDLLDFPLYYVEFRSGTQILAGQAVMDGREGQEFPLLSYDDYLAGTGGASDGKSAVVISLNDGVGVTGQRIEYYCEAVDGEELAGHPETTMQVDYRVNNGEILLTGDAGETWVSSGLTKDQVEETLLTYRNGNFLPDGSLYGNGNGFFALFYGETPTLRIIKNNGQEQQDIPFNSEMAREPLRRIVHFIDEQNGYAAIGTDWSMGTGGSTYVYWTHDGGQTWSTSLALQEDARMLTGIAFADQQSGMATQVSVNGEEWPYIYVTGDGGASFQEISLPFEAITGEVSFLSKIDSLSYENGTYTLVMGQGNAGNRKVTFVSNNLSEGWSYKEDYIGTVHTEG